MSELKELIDPKDLKIESYPVISPGGQHVSVVRTGARVTHVPTGLIAISDCERSQVRNRNLAMSMINFALNQLNYDSSNIH